MFITTRLRDPVGRIEQVFVAVDTIANASIAGRIWSDIQVVVGYRRGQRVAVAEGDILDWMIARPDGTEEGNWMGRFIDAMQATGQPSRSICAP